MVLETVGSSKSSNIRSLLIRAWRERWTDMQWGIHIKTVLPRYISGDIYHLSDCILQQALMGPLPNQLILSYLRHSLAAQVVSYGGVIESVSKYESFQKAACVRALLDLLSSITDKVSCRGKPEDCLALATALVAGVRWLLRVTLYVAGRGVQSSEQVDNLRRAVTLLQDYLNNLFLMGLLQIARLEEPPVWGQLFLIVMELEIKLSTVALLADFKESLSNIFVLLRSTNPLNTLQPSAAYDPRVTPICYGLNALILVEALLHSTRSSQALASQLLLYQQVKGLTVRDLYLELLVSCFLGLGSEEQFPHQNMHWVGFTFIKVPSVLQHLHCSFQGGASPLTPSEPLLAAFKELAVRSVLLDLADHRMNCNCLEHLLLEPVVRTSLISEQDAAAVLLLRKEDRNSPTALPVPACTARDGGTAIPNLILRAQPTVSSILKTLSNRNHESVLPVMNLLISGKSRDLLFTAAAASGKLFIYAQKFVKFNQQSLEPQPGETDSDASNRALMFDITFLLLCHIAQVYGIDVVVCEESETFVENWMRRHMPEKGRVKMIMPACRADSSGLLEVMQQVNAQDTTSKYCQVYWSSVCHAAPQIMHKLVSEVIQGSVSLQTAIEFLDRMCAHLCSLPICFTAWTCSYIHEVSGSAAQKVNALLNHLQHKLSCQEPSLCLSNFKDRSVLMSEILDSMVKVSREANAEDSTPDVDSLLSSAVLNFTLSGDLGDNLNVNERELRTTWDAVFRRSGLLTHTSLRTFQRLLRLGGHSWFVTKLVRCGMESVFEADLNRAMDLIYGIFQIDLQGCCRALLLDALPGYLSAPDSLVLHSFRRIGALARLTVQVLVAAWAAAVPASPQQVQGSASLTPPPSLSPHTTAVTNPAQKRCYSIMNDDVAEDALVRQASSLPIDPSCIAGLSNSAVAIMVAVHTLLNKLYLSVPKGVVSPISELVVALLQELVVAPSVMAPLLTLMPANLLSVLLALHPPATFTPCHLLALALPLSSPSLPAPLTPAREAAARRAAAKLLCTHRNFALAAASVDQQAMLG